MGEKKFFSCFHNFALSFRAHMNVLIPQTPTCWKTNFDLPIVVAYRSKAVLPVRASSAGQSRFCPAARPAGVLQLANDAPSPRGAVRPGPPR